MAFTSAIRTSTRMHDGSTVLLSPKRLRGVCRSWTRLRSVFAWTTGFRAWCSTCTSPAAFATLFWDARSARSFATSRHRTQKFRQHEQRRHSSRSRDVDGEKRRLYDARVRGSAHRESFPRAGGEYRRARLRLDHEAEAAGFDHHTRVTFAGCSAIRRRHRGGHRESAEGIEDWHYACG